MAFERFKPEVRRAQKRVAEQDYVDAQATIDVDRPIDKLRTDVTEVLGERTGILEGHYRRRADSLLEKVAGAEDHKDTPGAREAFIRHRKNILELKAERVQAKLIAKPTGFMARQREATLENIQYRQKVQTHTISKLEGRRTGKPERLQVKIDELINKKIKAMRRKAERTVLRKHGVDVRNRHKRIDALAHLTTEQKRQIVREAILLVRRENISHGRLDESYQVDGTLDARRVGDKYERTT